MKSGKTGLQEKTVKALGRVKTPAEIMVFMMPGCPYCASVVKKARAFEAENKNISVVVVDASKSPELVWRYSVMSTPKTVINREISLDGKVTEEELVEWVLKARSPEAKKEYLCYRLEHGEAERVARIAAEDPELAALLGEAAGCASMQARLGAMVALEEIKKKDGSLVKAAVPKIIALLEDSNPTIRNDAAYALGMFGGREGIRHLEKLLGDEDEGVVKTAKWAVEKLERK